MKRTFLLWLSILTLLAGGCDSRQHAKREAFSRPNILLLIADDLGYADLACYGGLARTPALNSLAKEGLLFSNFYAAAPNCSPSRAGLLTGKSPAKLGMYNYRPPQHPMHLRAEEITIAELLQAEGYQTAHIGKWHLGCLPQDSSLNHPQPDDQGFGFSFGTENNARPSHLNPVNFVRNGEALGERRGYSSHILADEAILWLEDQHQPDRPFFLYMAFHEPHKKVASPPQLVENYAGYPPEDAAYLANVENLDLAIGRVINYLKARDLLDNTLVLFSSDNGSYREASNGELRAVKSYLYEGGIRVPGILRWPVLKQRNIIIEEPAGFVDIKPTLCDILDIQAPDSAEWDGRSLLPLWQGETFAREKPLFWYFYRSSPEIALRSGDLMIMGRDNDSIPRSHQFSAPDMDYIKRMTLTSYELYDLSEDMTQRRNLFGEHPEAERYRAMLDAQLREIQEKGYRWPELPPANAYRRIKTDWVKYGAQ